MDHPFCAGLYFNANPPNNPIAYFKKKGGFYEPLWDYDEGSVLYVDSVGMGCTLIHRSVYEKIREEHVVFQRPTGSLFPIHKRNVLTWKKAPDTKDMPDTFVSDCWLHMKVIQPDNENDNRLFPYYAMEYGRTEDHHFCELAADVGIRPLLDTSIKCGHWKIGETTYEDYHQQVLIKAGLA